MNNNTIDIKSYMPRTAKEFLEPFNHYSEAKMNGVNKSLEYSKMEYMVVAAALSTKDDDKISRIQASIQTEGLHALRDLSDIKVLPEVINYEQKKSFEIQRSMVM